MLQEFVIHVPASFDQSERATVWESLATAFPALPGGLREVATPAPRLPTELLWVRVPCADWRTFNFDPVPVDRQVHTAVDAGWLRIALVADETIGAASLLDAATELVTRYQRFVDRRNGASATPQFERLLAAHRALYDLSKPLVRADYEHAIDAWRWMLRLEPTASAAAQIAVLFHDVERLVSESDVRIEQHAPDYVAFKRAHAARGATLTRNALRPLALGGDLIDRAVDLVARHEVPGEDPDLRLINDADALSFFSLNACGFLDYYGAAHTEKKIDYTLGRLSPAALPRLRDVKLRGDFADLLRGRLVKACIELACGDLDGPDAGHAGSALH
jgi:hypothetical protein